MYVLEGGSSQDTGGIWEQGDKSSKELKKETEKMSETVWCWQKKKKPKKEYLRETLEAELREFRNLLSEGAWKGEEQRHLETHISA